MNLNLDKTQIILASQSPRRRELMAQAGFNFEIITSDINEVITKELPSDVVMELSSQKADDVLRKVLLSVNNINSNYNPSFTDDGLSLMVIGADTVVADGNTIMGKPKNRKEAYNMLSSLSGKTHQVLTGVSIYLYNFAKGTTTVRSFTESTTVTFYPLTSSEINDYISTGDCYDKAGGYGIQGHFAIHVKGITGDYNNVVGLPIARLYQEIKEMV